MISAEAKGTPSAEIIITIPKDKGSKQYKTTLDWLTQELLVPSSIRRL